jgi:hypothetical protein
MSDGSGEKLKKFVFKTKTPNVGEGPSETLEVIIPEVKINQIRAACWRAQQYNGAFLTPATFPRRIYIGRLLPGLSVHFLRESRTRNITTKPS